MIHRAALNFEVTPVFRKNWHVDPEVKIINNRGGTRSSKTYSIAQIAVTWLFTGWAGQDLFIPTGYFSVVRKTLPALKASALRDVFDILDKYNLRDKCHYHGTDMELRYQGRIIEFFSLDDHRKVRSRKRALLWCVEANEFNYKEEFVQLRIRTSSRTWLDFNPDDIEIWINTELEDRRNRELGDVLTVISSYQSNPFLTKEEREEIEYMRHDPDFWRIFGLGHYGRIHGLIYPEPWLELPHMIDHGNEIYGLDFGYHPNPAACVRISINERTRLATFDEVLYQTGLTNQELASELKARRVKGRIFADPRDPKAIRELNQAGLNCYAAPGGKDSVRWGINVVKSLKKSVTSRSTNLIAEKRRYKWHEKGGQETGEPLKVFDHLMDAIRYGITGFYGKPRSIKLHGRF